MLSYLVTSSTRRRLLELLWARRAEGSVGELAERAHVSYAGAYRELQAMVRAGLAVRVHVDGGERYVAALDHPDADLVQRLVGSPAKRPPPSADDGVTRGQLRALGAPLADDAQPVPDGKLEEVLASSVALARRDPTVARVLPIVFARVRDKLDRARLETAARARHQKQAVGFFLALAGKLGHDQRLQRWSTELRDHRVKTMRPFFEIPTSREAERTAERRTPRLAREWGFAMSLQLEDFGAMFEKFTPGSGEPT